VTETERMARAHRAQTAHEEFIAPMFAKLREEYLGRMAEVSATELNAQRRADAITALSVALRVLGTLDAGMREIMRDGDLAKAEKLKAEKIAQMTDAQQRLLKIGAI
jgi:hypothetical protein